MSHPTGTDTRFGAVRRYPLDLALVSIAAVVAVLAVRSFPADSAVRLAAAVPLVVFLPGYALTSILFPAAGEASSRRATTDVDRRPSGIDGFERAGVSFALSIVLTPLVAMILPLTQWGLSTRTATIAIGVAVIVLAQIGVVRRLRVPEPDQFDVSVRRLLGRSRHSESDERGAFATMSSILLAAAVVGAIVALGFGIVSPSPAGGFTELGLYTTDGDGELVADDYPSELEPNESASLTVTVENQEGTDQRYTVVVLQERLEDGDVSDRTELDRFDRTVEPNDTAEIDHELEPDARGESVRVTYLLYQGDGPDDPSRDNAEEDVFVWVTVTDGDGGDDLDDAGGGTEGDGDDEGSGESEDEA